jgi:ABC-type transporter Mla subunit MlaD
MLPKLRDALLCLLLLSLLIGVVVAEFWLTHRAPKLDSILSHLDSATYNASDLTWQADEALIDARPILHKTLIHADQAAGETSRTMKHVAHTTQSWADEQEQVAAATMIVLGKTASTVQAANDAIDQNGEQLRFTLSELESSSKAAKHVLDDIDKRVNDQAITEALNDLHGAATEFNGTMAEVHGTSKDFHGYIHRLTAPMGFWKSLGKHALGFGEKVGANMVTP